MTVNSQFQIVHARAGMRGFANLFRKENRTWWGTRRWWINLILWPLMLGACWE